MQLQIQRMTENNTTTFCRFLHNNRGANGFDSSPTWLTSLSGSRFHSRLIGSVPSANSATRYNPEALPLMSAGAGLNYKKHSSRKSTRRSLSFPPVQTEGCSDDADAVCVCSRARDGTGELARACIQQSMRGRARDEAGQRGGGGSGGVTSSAPEWISGSGKINNLEELHLHIEGLWGKRPETRPVEVDRERQVSRTPCPFGIELDFSVIPKNIDFYFNCSNYSIYNIYNIIK